MFLSLLPEFLFSILSALLPWLSSDETVVTVTSTGALPGALDATTGNRPLTPNDLPDFV